MNPTASRFALAALLAALALPAFAASPADCTVCSDPFFPKLENPAPALVLDGKGEVFEAQAWPANVRVTTPAIAFRAEPHDGSIATEPQGDEAPSARHAVLLSAPAHLAARQ